MHPHARPIRDNRGGKRVAGACQVCKRAPDTTGLRRGLCRACYLRAWRGAELPTGAGCTLCPERRRLLLRWTRIGQQRIVTCQNCGFLADRARPKPRDVDDLKEHLARERRRVYDRRRNYVIDTQDPDEQRTAGRRGRRPNSG